MAHVRSARWRHTFGKGLLILALPAACAVGVEPDQGQNQGQAGTSAEAGTSTEAGSAGTGAAPMAGTSSTGGSGSLGGTSAGGSGGKAGSSSGGSGGKAGSGGSGGSTSAGAGGSSAGGSAGTGGAAGAGGSGGVCGCAEKTPWVDNTSIMLTTGECITVGTATYAYLGTTTQQYANKECNPTMQAAWCSGQQFIFMLCP